MWEAPNEGDQKPSQQTKPVYVSIRQRQHNLNSTVCVCVLFQLFNPSRIIKRASVVYRSLFLFCFALSLDKQQNVGS